MDQRDKFVRPGTSIEFVVGDIVDEQMDAFVIPFGDPTGTSSRVQNHIRQVAHSGLGDEIARKVALLPGGKLRAGDSIVTAAPGLSCKYLVHCHLIGVSAAAGSKGFSQSLRSALLKCEALGAQSVALPAIGTGAYGLASSDVAQTSVSVALEVQASSQALKRIRFVLSSSRTLEEFLIARSQFLP